MVATYNILRSYLIRVSQPRMHDCITMTALSRFFSNARSSRAAFVLSRNVVFIDSFAANILLVAPPRPPNATLSILCSMQILFFLSLHFLCLSHSVSELRIFIRISSHNWTLVGINPNRRKNWTRRMSRTAIQANSNATIFQLFSLSLSFTNNTVVTAIRRVSFYSIHMCEKLKTLLFFVNGIRIAFILGMKIRCGLFSVALRRLLLLLIFLRLIYDLNRNQNKYTDRQQ